ncbi:probable RNA-binding protein 46 isoform X1 [Eriocheir sinensis]|uniref:probable RNA-binding protein 46 isoform X1 n=1 Tax=Eriocheir sinensis TaxID=95602 RepID=UPI0021C830C4|nr:probable RNA-binding protein 46 isoform X1 [Eriocheir sinensis]
MTSGQQEAGGAADGQQQQQQELTPALRQLLERTNYPLVQESGHRRYGPPPGWEGPPPPKGCEVFVGKIPRDMFEDELVPVMERAGRLYEVRLMVDQAAANRGYGFVQYCSLPEAEAALRLLKDVEVRPKRYLGVSRSVDNNRLFVGGIPKTRAREEVLDEMRRVTEGVVKVILYPCVNDRTKNRGYAFVEYTSHKAAAMARRKLFSGRLLLWGSAEVKVDWAEPEHSVDSETMAKVRVLYIRNLALRTTEEDIRSMCEDIASGVDRVKKQKDYAFVHFNSREKAESVKAALDGRVVDGCELEVNWAKPVKNREEYQQKKALGRHMISAAPGSTNPAYLPHLTLTGEPMMVLPQVRKAAGTHGLQHHATHPTQTLPTHTQHIETTLLGMHHQPFISSETAHHHLKAPTELVLTGYPSMAAPLVTEKMAQSTDDQRGTLQNGSPVQRVVTNGQLLRGTPMAPPAAPQYIMAPSPQYFMPTPQALAAAGHHPQAIPVTSQPCIYPAAPTMVTGYEGLQPYLHAAIYQQALLTQPTMATLDRPAHQRYATGE